MFYNLRGFRASCVSLRVTRNFNNFTKTHKVDTKFHEECVPPINIPLFVLNLSQNFIDILFSS